MLCLGLSGGVLYAGGGDTKVRSYIAATMEQLQEMEGHSQPVNALAVTHKNVFSASDDGAVIKWSLPPLDHNVDTKPDPALSVPLTQRILSTPQPGNVRASFS